MPAREDTLETALCSVKLYATKPEQDAEVSVYCENAAPDSALNLCTVLSPMKAIKLKGFLGNQKRCSMRGGVHHRKVKKGFLF